MDWWTYVVFMAVLILISATKPLREFTIRLTFQAWILMTFVSGSSNEFRWMKCSVGKNIYLILWRCCTLYIEHIHNFFLNLFLCMVYIWINGKLCLLNTVLLPVSDHGKIHHFASPLRSSFITIEKQKAFGLALWPLSVTLLNPFKKTCMTREVKCSFSDPFVF